MRTPSKEQMAIAQKKILAILGNEQTASAVMKKYAQIFKKMGVPENDATMLADYLCYYLKKNIKTQGLLETEREASERLQVIPPLTGSYPIPLKKRFRAALINFVDTKLCNNSLLQTPELKLNARNKNHLFRAASQKYKTSLANSFLCTARTDFWIKELTRLTREQIILVERIPSEDKIHKDVDFMTAYLLDRLFCYTRPPISLKTEAEWTATFEKYGWKNTHSASMGKDPADNTHQLMVFEKT